MSLRDAFSRRCSFVTLGLLTMALANCGCGPVGNSPTQRLADATAEAADAKVPDAKAPDAAARTDAAADLSTDTSAGPATPTRRADKPTAIAVADADHDTLDQPADVQPSGENGASDNANTEDSLAAAIESAAAEDDDDDLPTERFVPEPDTLDEDVLLVAADELKRLHPEYNVWIDPQGQRLVMAGQVCRQEGFLEMFACLKGTKEHESIVSVYSRAFIVHAGLLALGAEPGRPVTFRPEYVAAEGPEVEVTVLWKDDKGELHEARGQDWVQYVKTEEALDSPWVFGGSGFWKNELTGQENYMAEDGDFICVSNFPSAMLDLPVESSQAASDLLFQAYTERIPPVGTPVTMILTPLLKPVDEEAAKEISPNAQPKDENP